MLLLLLLGAGCWLCFGVGFSLAYCRYPLCSEMVYWPISAAFKWQSRRGGHAGEPKVTQSHKLPNTGNTSNKTQSKHTELTTDGRRRSINKNVPAVANWKPKRKSIDVQQQSIQGSQAQLQSWSRCAVCGGVPCGPKTTHTQASCGHARRTRIWRRVSLYQSSRFDTP